MKSLYSSLLSRGPSPALVWYSKRGRIELSGAVLARHLAKNAAFLEAECEEGTGVVLDLPVDWKMVTWALSALLAGAPLAFFDVSSATSETSSATLLAPSNAALTTLDLDAYPWGGIVFSNESESYLRARASAHASGSAGIAPAYPQSLLASWPSLIAVDLAPLALRWMGEPLEASILDGNAEPMGYPDSYAFTSSAALADMATPGQAGASAWAALGEALAQASGTPATETSTGKRALQASTICLDFTGIPLAHAASAAACFAICLHYIRYGCVVVATAGKAEDIAAAERAQLICVPSLCPQA